MKKKIYIIICLINAFASISAQDFYIKKSNFLKGDYPIASVLLVTDSIEDPLINYFSDSFAANLKAELKKHDVECYLAKRNTISVLEDVVSIIEKHDPNATIILSPNRPVYIQFKMLQAPKESIMFDFVLNYRNSNKSSYELYNTGIGISLNSLMSAGKPVCEKIVEKIQKAKYIK